ADERDGQGGPFPVGATPHRPSAPGSDRRGSWAEEPPVEYRTAVGMVAAPRGSATRKFEPRGTSGRRAKPVGMGVKTSHGRSSSPPSWLIRGAGKTSAATRDVRRKLLGPPTRPDRRTASLAGRAPVPRGA